MNWELFKKYGGYNKDGYYITDHEKWDYYANNPQKYRLKMIGGFSCLLIPICGIVLTHLIFEEMGLSVF